MWFDNDDVLTRVWDQDKRTWVASGLSGPPGPIGPTGTYQTIVGDTAPTRRIDNTHFETVMSGLTAPLQNYLSGMTMVNLLNPP